MARGRSQSSNLRFFSVAYYIRRPDRLIFIFLLAGAVTFFFWDRHGLVLQHEVDQANNGKLNEEKAKLVQEVDQLKSLLKRRTEELHFELDNDESREFDLETKDDSAEYEADAIEEKKHRAPVLKVTLDGLQDAPSDLNPIARERRDKVREAMIHAWSSYEKYAWGFDELKPVSKEGSNDFGGLGATIVDALDTLFIMGLHEQFEKATEWVATSLDFNKHYHASVFETTIRVLGGLLSSFDLSKNPVFLTKAQDLADRLLPAWNTATGIPLNSIDLASGTANNPSWTPGGSNVLADLGTEQVELIGLSQRTGIPKYKEKAEKVIRKLQEVLPSDGLLPIYISSHTGQPTTQRITFGAMGDSFYEYLLKVWMLGNKTHVVQHYRDMWEQSMEGMISLVKKSNPSSYLYIAERSGDILQDKMDELACFAPGMLALGMDGATPQKASQYLEIAEGLAKTCYNFYMTTPTKLAGENYHFRDGEDMVVGTSYNILRPETIESLFYLWRRTGDAKYRDWGWDIFQAFETQSRIPTGYVGLYDVQSGLKDNKMQSFFLAETLKYLYLLFSPASVIPLDEWVFNTEAHPIRIMTRLDDTVDGGAQEGREESHRRDDTHGREGSHLRDETGGRAQLNRIDRSTGQRRYIRKGSTKGTGPFDYR